MTILSKIKNNLPGLKSSWSPLLIVGGALATTAGAYYIYSKFIRQHRTTTAENCDVVDPGCSLTSTSQSDTDVQDRGLEQEFHISVGPAVKDGTLCASHDKRPGLRSPAQQTPVTVDHFRFHKVLGRGQYAKGPVFKRPAQIHRPSWHAIKSPCESSQSTEYFVQFAKGLMRSLDEGGRGEPAAHRLKILPLKEKRQLGHDDDEGSKVFLAEMKGTDEWFAIKALSKLSLKDADIDRVMVEKAVLKKGQYHPFLTYLYSTFQSKEHLFFVMEFLNGGDLAFHLKNGSFDLSRATFYAAEIVSGLQFLHRNGIIHRDLKLGNVLLDKDGHIHLTDFGFCQERVSADNLASGFIGTPEYMAPEVIRRQKYSFSVDWWSFGVLLHLMLTNKFPFSGEDDHGLYLSICYEAPNYPPCLTAESRDMLQQLFERDPARRLGVQSDIRAHPFFTTVDWSALENKAVEPPFKPELNVPNDHRYFHQQYLSACFFSSEETLVSSIDQSIFSGFSFTSRKMKALLRERSHEQAAPVRIYSHGRKFWHP